MPEDFSPVIADILNRLEKLEKEVELLRLKAAPEENAAETTFNMDFSDISDLSGLDIPEPSASVDSEDLPVAEIAPEAPEEIELPAPEDLPEIELPALEETVPEAVDSEEPAVEEKPFEVEAPVSIEPSSVETVSEEPLSEEHVSEETVLEEPVSEEPAVAKTAEESPSGETPAPEYPAAEKPEEESFGNLFGEDIPAREPEKKTRRSAARETINDEASSTRTVLDAMTDKSAWRHDIPGPEVKELRSAIGLGDKVFFCHSLFRDDNALYQDTVARINSMKELDEAVDYLASTFPEWDWNSDTVYRFMMAVRRKVRK